MAREREDATTNERIESKYEEYITPIWKELNVPVKAGDGATITDFDGNEYLDLLSGIAVVNTGHGNQAVVSAAKEQLDALTHGCTYVHPNEPAATLAERIAEITPGDLQKSFFCNSGTEAVEGAVKLARKHTGSKEIVAVEMAFHGRTLGSLALTGNNSYKDGMGPTLNDVAHFAPPYAYRCPSCDADGGCTSDCAKDLDHVIRTHTSGDVAAVILEPVMGEGGIIVPSNEWLRTVRDITHENDALLIVDEVQTGYGRTGSMWASDHFDITPDILTQAKGIANGLPLGAFTAPADVADSFESGDHLSTFGGNPVACAASLAQIEQLQNGIVRDTRDHGRWLQDRLSQLVADHDVVGDARGLGLMHGVEIVDPASTGPMGQAAAPDATLTKRISTDLREEGIIMAVGGFYKNVLRIQPSLVIDRAQLETAIDTLDHTLAEAT